MSPSGTVVSLRRACASDTSTPSQSQTHQQPHHAQEQEHASNVADVAARSNQKSENMGATESRGVNIQEQMLDAALPHVQQVGWTLEALRRGARSLGLSQSAATLVEDGEAALVEHFWVMSDAQWRSEMDQRAEELHQLELDGQLKLLLKARLEQIRPYANTWAQALAIQTRPRMLQTAVRLRADFADDVWHRVGDSSLDSSWYIRRGLLASTMLASEVAQISDMSAAFTNSDAFIDRRIHGLVDFDARIRSSATLASSTLDSFAHNVVSFLSRFRN